MSRLGFLSPDRCGPGVALVSPLRHVDPSGVLADRSSLGKLEIRGEVATVEPGPDEQLLPLGPGRALLVTEGSPAAARERLAGPGRRVYDRTAALAALEFDGTDLLRRLTDLDPRSLPAVGPVARGVQAVIERRPPDGPGAGERYRLYVPQELAHYVGEVVVDMARGLGR